MCIVSNKRFYNLSARDVYEELYNSGVELEPKGFAVGFRIEHPQRLINEIQYGKDWGARVVSQSVRCGCHYHLACEPNIESCEYSCTSLTVHKAAINRFS